MVIRYIVGLQKNINIVYLHFPLLFSFCNNSCNAQHNTHLNTIIIIMHTSVVLRYHVLQQGLWEVFFTTHIILDPGLECPSLESVDEDYIK